MTTLPDFVYDPAGMPVLRVPRSCQLRVAGGGLETRDVGAHYP